MSVGSRSKFVVYHLQQPIKDNHLGISLSIDEAFNERSSVWGAG